jgi:hypothetical protein
MSEFELRENRSKRARYNLATHPPYLAIHHPSLAIATHPSHLATHLSHLATHPPYLANQPPKFATQPPHLATHPPNLATHPPYLAIHPPHFFQHLPFSGKTLSNSFFSISTVIVWNSSGQGHFSALFLELLLNLNNANKKNFLYPILNCSKFNG